MVEVAPRTTEIRINYWRTLLFLLLLLLLALGVILALFDSHWGANNSYAETMRKYLSTLNRFRPNAKPEDNLANALHIHGVERLSGQKYALFFSVTDANSEPITTLTKTAVTLAIGDPGSAVKPVVIDRMTPLHAKNEWGTERMTFASVMDYSGSMFPEDLQAIETNYSAFITALSFPFYASVFKFNSGVEEVLSLSNNIPDIEAAIQKRITLGNTALFEGMNRGLENIKSKFHLRFLLLSTDGNNNIHGVSQEDVIKNCRQAFVSAFVMGFGWLNVDVLKKIANETDGYYVYVPDSSELKNWFPKLAKIVNNVQVVEFVTSIDIQPTSPIELSVNTGNGVLKRSR